MMRDIERAACILWPDDWGLMMCHGEVSGIRRMPWIVRWNGPVVSPWFRRAGGLAGRGGWSLSGLIRFWCVPGRAVGRGV
jgi:hypothetical protein